MIVAENHTTFCQDSDMRDYTPRLRMSLDWCFVLFFGHLRFGSHMYEQIV